MSEGNIYLAQCVKENNNYKLLLKEPFKFLVTGTTIDDAKLELALEISRRLGDGEAIIEIFPPLKSESKIGVSCLVTAAYNSSVSALNGELLFGDGVCEKCRFGKGQRDQKVLLEVDRKPAGMVCGVVQCYPSIKIYSERFIKQLKSSELSRMTIKPVLHNGEKCGYFEAIPNDFVEHSGHKGATYPEVFQQSWACNMCNRKNFVVESNEYDSGTVFICGESFDSVVPSVLFIDEGYFISMAFTHERWKEFLRNEKKGNLVSNSVVLVYPNFQEIPELSEPKNFEWV